MKHRFRSVSSLDMKMAEATNRDASPEVIGETRICPPHRTAFAEPGDLKAHVDRMFRSYTDL